MPKVPFIGSNYQSASKNVSSQTCKNMYLEIVDNPYGKAKFINIDRAGIGLFVDLGLDENDCRGLFKSATGSFFAVFGNTLYKITSPTSYEILSIGISGSQISKVSFTENIAYMILADGVQMYAYNHNTGAFTSVDYPIGAQPKQVNFVEGRAIAINSGGNDAERNKVYNSEAGLGGEILDWKVSNYFVAEKSADAIQTMQVSNGFVWLFGNESYEIHRPSKVNDNDPFDLIQSTTSAMGCKAPLGSCVVDDTVYWVGSSSSGTGMLYRSNGLGSDRISNHDIERNLTTLISQGRSIEDAVLFGYQMNGHTFVVFNLLSLNITYVYDTTTGEFYTYETYNRVTKEGDRWKPLYAIEYNGQILVGGVNGQIWNLSDDIITDYDSSQPSNTIPIVRERTSMIYYGGDDYFNMILDEFAIDMETGVGLVLPEDQGFDPKAMIQISRDGGYTWDNEEMVGIGKIGEYTKRCVVRGKGMGRNFVVRFRISDPVRCVLIGATAKFRKTRGR